LRVKIGGELWSVVVVSVLSVLIWVWAAGETRELQSQTCSVKLTCPPDWQLSEDFITPTVWYVGSKVSLRACEELLSSGLSIDVPAQRGSREINLLEELRAHDDLLATGVTIDRVEPETVTLAMDELIRVPVSRIDPKLPGVQFRDLEIAPVNVMVTMPSLLRESHPEDLSVEAFVERDRLLALPAEILHTLNAVVRLPQPWLRDNPSIRVSPTSVPVTFTILSQRQELVLETVPVQVAGAWKDFTEYEVKLVDAALRNVTIEADVDLIRRINARELSVVAVLHLSLRDKERAIERKQVGYFIALPIHADTFERSYPVTFKRVGDSPEWPVINLEIRPLQHSP
jgi:hypothetical protein